MRHAARLILHDPQQKRRHPLVVPALSPELPDSRRPSRVQRLVTPSGPESPLILGDRVENPTAERPRARDPRWMRALRRVPPPGFGRASEHTLQHLRLGAVQLAVRVQRRMDHRSERRRPGWTNRVAPSPSAVPTITVDALPAVARTPLLVVRECIASDAHAVRDRVIERRPFFGRVDMHERHATPATRSRLDPDQRQLIDVNATTSHRPSVLARRPSPAAPPWVACDPKEARLLPGCDRNREDGSQIDHFSCGAVRTPAQVFCLHRSAYRSSFALVLPSGGGGNRTRVRGRTEQSVYERSSRFISPAGRFANDLPTGQPS